MLGCVLWFSNYLRILQTMCLGNHEIVCDISTFCSLSPFRFLLRPESDSGVPSVPCTLNTGHGEEVV